MEDFEKALSRTEGQEEEVGRLYDLIISEFDRLATMTYMAQIMNRTNICPMRQLPGAGIYNTDLYAELGDKAAPVSAEGPCHLLMPLPSGRQRLAGNLRVPWWSTTRRTHRRDRNWI